MADHPTPPADPPRDHPTPAAGPAPGPTANRPPDDAAPPTTTVLVVCTGNICRSPAIERLLAHALGPETPVRVTSAGTHAVVGAAISPPMADLVAAAGATATDFAARQLTAELVADADLILVATRRHRAAVVDLVPAAVRRVFTVRELARFITEIDLAPVRAAPWPQRVPTLVAAAAARRGQTRTHPADDDVIDPYGADDAIYQLSFAQLDPAVSAIATALRGPA